MRKYKIVLLGSSGVGKTSLMIRLVKNKFYEYIDSTIGSSFFSIKRDNNVIQIWDTAGQERYKSLINMYLRNCDAILFVYNILEPCQDDINYWFNQVNKLYFEIDKKPILYLIGNKVDLLEQSIDLNEIMKTNEKNITTTMPISKHISTSAKNGLNAVKIIDEIINDLKIFVNDIVEDDIIKNEIVETKIENRYLGNYLNGWCNYI